MKTTRSTFSIVFSAVTTTWIHHIVQIISGLVVLPLIISHLGKTNYGIWVLVGQTINFFSLSDLGVASAIGRSTARFRGSNDSNAMDQLHSTALLILTASGIIVALLSLLLSPWVPEILNIQRAYHSKTVSIFLISSISLALQFPLKIGVGVLTGHQLYWAQGTAKIAGSIFSLASFSLLGFLDAIDLTTVALVSASGALLTQLLLAFSAWRLTRPWHLKPGHISLPIGRELISVGGSSVVVTLSNLGYRSGLGIAVGRLLGTEAAGVYGVALAVINQVQPLISSLSTPFMTLSSEWHAGREIARLRAANNLVMRVTVALSASLAVGLFFYSEPALHLLFSSGGWTAADFKTAGNTLSIMGLGLAVGLPQVVSRSTLQGVGKHWQVGYAFMFISLLSLAIGILGMNAGLGLYGAALGWGLFWAFQGILFYPVMICRYLKQTLWSMILSAYMPGIVVGAGMLALAWVLNGWLAANRILNLIVGISVYSVFCCIAIIAISGHSKTLWDRITRRLF